MFHAIALVLVGLIVERYAGAMLQGAGWAMLVGVLLFSGGIYAWLATGIKPFVHVVPIGGLSLIAGWVLLAVGLLAGTVRSQ